MGFHGIWSLRNYWNSFYRIFSWNISLWTEQSKEIIFLSTDLCKGEHLRCIETLWGGTQVSMIPQSDFQVSCLRFNQNRYKYWDGTVVLATPQTFFPCFTAVTQVVASLQLNSSWHQRALLGATILDGMHRSHPWSTIFQPISKVFLRTKTFLGTGSFQIATSEGRCCDHEWREQIELAPQRFCHCRFCDYFHLSRRGSTATLIWIHLAPNS